MTTPTLDLDLPPGLRHDGALNIRGVMHHSFTDADEGSWTYGRCFYVPEPELSRAKLDEMLASLRGSFGEEAAQ